jgi:hypothetical protein
MVRNDIESYSGWKREREGCGPDSLPTFHTRDIMVQRGSKTAGNVRKMNVHERVMERNFSCPAVSQI